MKSYLITSREFYTDTPAVFRGILQEQLIQYMPDFVLYRDKSNPHYAIQADHFVEVCRNFVDLKSFLHQEYTLAASLGADGVHLTSKQFDKIQDAKSLGLEVIISTHTKEEVKQAQKLGADYVTYSPIFATPAKGTPKGVEDLAALVQDVDIKVFALGGIVGEEQVQEVKKTTAFGFASIRYFY
jgi:thiamine-phosphate pyrophosphorylase